MNPERPTNSGEYWRPTPVGHCGEEIADLQARTAALRAGLKSATLRELLILAEAAPDLEVIHEEIKAVLEEAHTQGHSDRVDADTMADITLDRYPSIIESELTASALSKISPEQAASTTERLSRAAHNEASRLRSRILDSAAQEERPQVAEFLEQLETADEAKLKELGIDITSTWLNAVTRRIAQGGRTVLHGLRAKALHANYQYPSEGQQLNAEQPQVKHTALSAAFREIKHFHPQSRLLQMIFVDDQADATGRRLSRPQRNAFTLQVMEHLNSLPLVGPMPSRDFYLKRSGRMHHILDSPGPPRPASHILEPRALRKRGPIYWDDGDRKNDSVCRSIPVGCLADIDYGNNAQGARQLALDYFPPEEILRQYVHSPKRYEELVATGIRLIAPDSRLTRPAQIACSLFDTIPTEEAPRDECMHLIITDENERNAYEEALLIYGSYYQRGSTLVRPIFVDYTKISDELADYAILSQFAQAVDNTTHSIKAFEKSKPMNSREIWTYLHHNYGVLIPPEGKGPLGKLREDQEIIERLIPLLPILFPNGIDSLAADGWGPYTYLGQLLEPYLKQGVSIEANDIAASNLKMALDWKQGAVDPETAQIAPDFEDLMIALGQRHALGNRYVGSAHRTRHSLEVEYGDITKLRASSTHVRIQGFVACSSSTSKEYFWKVVKGMEESLEDKPDATLVSLHMVGSKQWQRFPSVPLSVEEIRQAYSNAGLDVVVIPITGGELREGYEGMVIVIARRLDRGNQLRDTLHLGLLKQQDSGPNSNTVLKNECPLGCATCAVTISNKSAHSATH